MSDIDSAAALGALVREHRKRLRVTQEELARAVGKQRRWVIELESGAEGVGLGAAIAAARAVGLRLGARSRFPTPGETSSPPHWVRRKPSRSAC